jgi:F-type H+-transporting ATPase subunit delta
VVTAVERRWTAARDLADALEQLGVIAVVRSTDEGERLADELFAFEQFVKDIPELRDALSDPARSLEDKRVLVRGLLDGKALPATIRLVEQALTGTHRTVGVALQEYQRVAAEVHGEGVATVHVAHPLSDVEQRRLADSLARQYGRPVHLNVVVSPEVIGGIRVEIGDDVIDGTVSSRLDEARRKLVG